MIGLLEAILYTCHALHVVTKKVPLLMNSVLPVTKGNLDNATTVSWLVTIMALYVYIIVGLLLSPCHEDLVICSSLLDLRDPAPSSLADRPGARVRLSAIHVAVPAAQPGLPGGRSYKHPGTQPLPSLLPRHQLPIQVLGAVHHGGAIYHI